MFQNSIARKIFAILLGTSLLGLMFTTVKSCEKKSKLPTLFANQHYLFYNLNIGQKEGQMPTDTVSFNSKNTQKYGAIAVQVYDKDQSISLYTISNVLNNAYYLEGWYYDTNLQKKAQNGDIFNFNHNTTLYAKWCYSIAYLFVTSRTSVSYDATVINSTEILNDQNKLYPTNSTFDIAYNGNDYNDYNTAPDYNINKFVCWNYQTVKGITPKSHDIDEKNNPSPTDYVMRSQDMVLNGAGKIGGLETGCKKLTNFGETTDNTTALKAILNKYYLLVFWADQHDSK